MVFQITNTFGLHRSYKSAIYADGERFRLKITLLSDPKRVRGFTVVGNLFFNERYISGLFETGTPGTYYGDAFPSDFWPPEYLQASGKVFFTVTLTDHEVTITPRTTSRNYG